jgi:type II secretory pathway pseudopilin PulG
MRLRGRTTRAISLVEVLIVVGILLFLAGVVFSLTGSGRETARQAKCIEQMRQIHQATLLYSAEYNVDHEILGIEGISGAVARSGATVLDPYVKDRSVFYCPDLPGSLTTKVAMSYIWVPVPADFDPTSPGEGGMLRQQRRHIERLGSKYPLLRCTIHDDVYYWPKEAHVDRTLSRPFVIEIAVDGSVFKGRGPAPRRLNLVEAWSSIP